MTDVVFEIVEANPGLTTQEIRQHPAATSIRRPSFPYVQLFKLKRGGEIVEREGRYYAVENSTPQLSKSHAAESISATRAVISSCR